MTKTEILHLVDNELKAPTHALIGQHLALHQPVFENGLPIIAKFVHNEPTHEIIAYLPVAQHHFYFVVIIDDAVRNVIGFYIEPGHRIYLRATSEELDFQTLTSLTKLEPQSGWSKGDQMANGKSSYSFSGLKIELDPEPDTFENKLGKLLDLLESDRVGIQALSAKADVSIQVASYYHVGNQMLGGHFMNPQTIQRLSSLGLGIDFDIYVEGNAFP